MAVDPLVERDQVVCDLRDAIRDGESGLQYVPRLLRHVLETEAWKERYDAASKEVVPFRTFREFVTATPTQGLGVEVTLVQRIVGDDPSTAELLDKALQRPVGRPSGPTEILSNRQDFAPAGTTRTSAMRRLRKDAPELHAAVVEGRISAHAAMIRAGFRPETATVSIGDPVKVAAVLRKKMSAKRIQELVQLLSEEVP